MKKGKPSARIIIADDHAIIREGLVALLEGEPDLAVVGQADTGEAALTMVREHQPDLALLDITMPDMNGLEATRQMKQEVPDVSVLILTMHEEEAFFFEALRAGASGYLLKGAHSEELLNALRTVREGGVYLSPDLAGELVKDYLVRNPEPPLDDPLTPREQEVLTFIAKGYTNSEIAEHLTLSINTIKTHRSRIYSKLELHDRASLVGYALRRGLLQS